MNNRLRDIPKSRVFTTGFKLFSGLAVFALTAGFLTAMQTCKPDLHSSYPPIECTGQQGLIDSMLGGITFGWKGGVGNLLVYTLWVGLAAVGIFLAGLMTAFRDADPQSVAEAARTDVPPPVNPPQHLSFWPVVAALSVALMAIGLVVNTATFVAGFVGLGLSALMWSIRNWAEATTGDPDVNEEIRERFAFGLEVPLVAGVIIALMAMSLSRVMLSVSSTQAVVVAGVAATVIFVLGTLVAYVPRIGKNAVTIFLMLGAFVVIASGVVSGAQGEREFEHHETGTSHAETDTAPGGDTEPAPAGQDGAN